MKQQFIVIVAWLVLLSCTHKPEQHPDAISVNLLIDITDHRQVYPDPKSILPLFKFDAEKNKAAFFRISTITDREINSTVELELPIGSETEKENTESDLNYREKRIVQFLASVQTALLKFTNAAEVDTSRMYSECFKSIANELHSLVRHKPAKGVLLIYSDLQERSSIWNCYTSINRELMKTSPDTLRQIFENTQLLPKDLTNVTVCFVYNPTSRDDDMRFMAMYRIYKTMFTSRRAAVMVSADNFKLRPL